MSAVTVIGKKIKLSFSYDTITMYPQDDADPGLYNRCRDAQVFFMQMLYGVPDKLARSIVSADRNKPLQTCLTKFTKQAQYDRFIHQDDPDHRLYHQDNIDREENHFHVKFKQPFKRNELELILAKLVMDDLMTAEESKQFFAAYDKRQHDAFGKLGEAMRGDIHADTKTIVRCIMNIKDNDLLANLHDYLLECPRFGHIMRSLNSEYRGALQDGKLVTVTKEWADIEKAISLQMVANLRAVTTMEKHMRMDRANQFGASHAFFGIKHKTKHPAFKVNNVTLKLVNGDDQQLDAQYKKHMGKF